MAAAAAAGWDLGPGAGPRYDDKLTAKTLVALKDLAATIPRFAGMLQNKEQLDERQCMLSQTDGSIETTGGIGEQTRFRVHERIGEGTFCVVFNGELLLENPADGEAKPVALKFASRCRGQLSKSTLFFSNSGKPHRSFERQTRPSCETSTAYTKNSTRLVSTPHQLTHVISY